MLPQYHGVSIPLDFEEVYEVCRGNIFLLMKIILGVLHKERHSPVWELFYDHPKDIFLKKQMMCTPLRAGINFS